MNRLGGTKETREAMLYSISHRMGINWIAVDGDDGYTPEDDRLVLINVEYCPVCDVGRYIEGKWHLGDNDEPMNRRFKVTAWMPVPLPYEIVKKDCGGYDE